MKAPLTTLDPLGDPEYWKRVDALLEIALEMPESERERWLESLAPEQSSLKPLLRTMLMRPSVETDSFMARPVGVNTMEAAAIALHGDKAGETVGPYRLIQEIGAGGMATVWLAERIDGTMQRRVALKLPLTAWDANLTDRMLRERDILSSLEHPNIARLYDAGITENGRPYLAMENVDGQPIDDYIRQHNLPIDARLRLFLQVAKAVTHAHTRLVVHRDLKPTNIMVDVNGGVHLLDFGVAKLLSNDATPGAKQGQLTQKTGRAMTPDYASPEQIRGEPIAVGSDVYSLGVVLYELLTGMRPYKLKRNTPGALEDAIINTDAPLASSAVANDKASDGSVDKKRMRALQGDIDNILAKTLKKNVQDRYQSVEAFADDIARHLAGEPVLARPDTLYYKTGKFIQRNRTAVALSAVIAIAVIAGVTGTIIQAKRAEQQALQAKLERDRAIQELTFAEAAEEFMRFLLSEESGTAFTTAQLLARAEVLADEQYKNDPKLQARMLLMVADLYGELNNLKKVEELLTRAKAAAQASQDENLNAQIDCTTASLFAVTGKRDSASDLFDKVMSKLEPNTNADPIALQTCYVNRSVFYRNRGKTEASLLDAERAVRLLGTPRPGQLTSAILLDSMVADSKMQLGRYDEAFVLYEKALAKLHQSGRSKTTSAEKIVNNLVVLLTRAGQQIHAQTVYMREVAENPSLARTTGSAIRMNYANTLTEIGGHVEAIQIITAQLTIAEKNGNARGVANGMLAMAQAFLVTGDFIRCEQYLTGAESSFHKLLPSKHSTFALLETIRGQILLKHQKPKPATEKLQAAIVLFEVAPERNLYILRALSELARAEQMVGNNAAARENATKAVSMAREALNGFSYSEWLGRALLAQGFVYKNQNDIAAARAALTEAVTNLVESVGNDASTTKEAIAMLASLDAK